MKALTKDLIDNPELWRLSLLIGKGGIDVFAHPVVGEGSVICEHIAFDASLSSDASALEDVVYANPLLLMPFRKVDVVVSNATTTVVPADVQPEVLGKLLRTDRETLMLESAIDDREKLVFALDRGIANFIGRTYDGAVPVHVLSVLSRYFRIRGGHGNTSKMFVNLGADSLDLIVYNNLGLAAARHIDAVSIDECAYWSLALFKQCGLDVDYDEIIIAGDSERRHGLMPLLSKFVNNVMPAIFPSAAYHGSSIAGKAPFPLVIMPLCE